MKRIIKTIIVLIATLMANLGLAQGCPRQIITKPDGTMMVCYYCNDGRTVNCFNL